MNLFIEAHERRHGSDFDRIGTGWEDTLTELLAFYLRSDEEALQAVVSSLLGDRWEPAVAVHTQLQFGGDRPDLVVELQSGHLLCIENKVDAGLGHQQLERYLGFKHQPELPSYVALISRRHMPVSNEVLASDRYSRPPGRDHWFWQDVYRLIPAPHELFGVDHLRRCFLDYLELLGAAPSQLTGGWQELLGPQELTQEIRKEFGRKLAGVRRWFTDRGFRVTGASHSGIQATPLPGCEYSGDYTWLALHPARIRRHLMEPEFSHRPAGEVLRVFLVYNSREAPLEALSVYQRFPRPLVDGNGFEWWPVAPYVMTNGRIRLEVVSSLQPFLADETLIEERLTAGCTSAAQELLSLAQSLPR